MRLFVYILTILYANIILNSQYGLYNSLGNYFDLMAKIIIFLIHLR